MRHITRRIGVIITGLSLLAIMGGISMTSASAAPTAKSVNVPIAYPLVCFSQRNYSSGALISVTGNYCEITGVNTIGDSSLIGPISKIVVKLTGGTTTAIPLNWSETVNGSTTSGTTTLTSPATFTFPNAIPAGGTGNVDVAIDVSGEFSTLLKLPLMTLTASNS